MNTNAPARSNPVFTLVLGVVIAAGGLWMLTDSRSANSPAAASQDQSPALLFTLARTGNVEQIRQAVRAGEFVNAVCPEPTADLPRGSSPLMVAARHGRADVVRELRRCGALVNARAQNGWTALHVAAAFGHTSVIDALAEAGEDLELDATMRGGLTPAQLATAVGQPECARRLEQLASERTATVASQQK